MSKRLLIKNTVSVNTYSLIDRAVDEGVNCGYMRAHKHGNPTEDGLKDYMHREVMNALSEVLQFQQEE